MPGTDDRTAPDLPQPAALEWEACDDGPTRPWECADLAVPVDYGDSAGAQVTLALTRLPAPREQRRGVILFNPGGPGGSGVDAAWQYAAVLDTALGAADDIVGWDPRGVGRSDPVTCDGSPFYDAEIAATCRSDASGLVAYVGAPNSAHDMEMIRRAFGDERSNYVEFSYGTALGAV